MITELTILQSARELELRNFQQAIEGNGKPAAWVNNEAHADDYTVGANEGVMQNILREEWGFKGYCVTDFSQVSPKAAPKESILFGTTAFCGSRVTGDVANYWNEDALKKDANICAAIKLDLKYNMYSLAQTLAMNGYNTSTHTVQLDTPWRQLYRVTENSSYKIFSIKRKGGRFRPPFPAIGDF